jgi:NitT/TauT family transport system substrate-binding protein
MAAKKVRAAPSRRPGEPCSHRGSGRERGARATLRRVSLVTAVVFALLLAACAPRAETAPTTAAPGSPAAPPQPLRARVAVTGLSGAQLPVWAAQEAGLFTQHGLDVELSYIATSQTAMGALLASEIDVLSGGPEALLAVAVEGGDVVSVGANLNKVVQALMVAPAIREPQDLRGRTIGVTRIASLSGSVTQYLLRQWGLKLDEDVTLIQTGGHPETVGAMAAAGIDGGMIPPPLTLKARELGFHELGNLWSQPLDYPGNIYTVRRPVQPDQEEMARRLVAALVESTHRVVVDRPLAVAVLGKYVQSEDVGSNEEAVGVYAPLFDRNVRPSREALRSALDELAAANPRAAAVSPDDMMDLRFVEEVERSGLAKRLYEQ